MSLLSNHPTQFFFPFHFCLSSYLFYLLSSPERVCCNARQSLWEMRKITVDFYLSDPGVPFVFLSQHDLSHTSAFYCCVADGSWPMPLLFSLHPFHYCYEASVYWDLADIFAFLQCSFYCCVPGSSVVCFYVDSPLSHFLSVVGQFKTVKNVERCLSKVHTKKLTSLGFDYINTCRRRQLLICNKGSYFTLLLYLIVIDACV